MFYKTNGAPPHFPWIQVQVRRDLETSLIRHTESAADVPRGTSYSCLSIISTFMPSIRRNLTGNSVLVHDLEMKTQGMAISGSFNQTSTPADEIPRFKLAEESQMSEGRVATRGASPCK